MKYIIIGLGNYGSVLAEELSILGHEVIGADINESRAEALKDKIATSLILDATNEQALSTLPFKDVDIVIVAIGENFGASIRVVALLKKNKVKYIYARAVDDLHKTVLEAFELDSILTPEKEAARSLVQSLDLNLHVNSFRIDDKHYIIQFGIPPSFVGYNINELSIEKEFHIKVIALVKGEMVYNSLGISVLEHQVDNHFEEDYLLEAEDKLVCYGLYKDFMAFWKAL